MASGRITVAIPAANRNVMATSTRRFWKELAGRIVRENSWRNIPEEKKGTGKFYRKAQVGSWREDLRPEETRLVEEITASILERFYSI